MNLGPGSSSSRTNTSNYNQNAGFSEVGMAQSLNLAFGNKSKGNSVTVVDGGAINALSGIAGEALRQVELAGNNTRSSISDAIQRVAESARSEQENVAITLGKWAMIAAVVYFGFRAVAAFAGRGS
jgi:hypothetical protein